MPLVMDTVITPMASALLESSAIAASPLSLPFCDRRSSKNAATTTTGTATAGARLSAVAMASAPKPTWLSPSPIME